MEKGKYLQPLVPYFATYSEKSYIMFEILKISIILVRLRTHLKGGAHIRLRNLSPPSLKMGHILNFDPTREVFY